jgi:hypothetical protein
LVVPKLSGDRELLAAIKVLAMSCINAIDLGGNMLSSGTFYGAAIIIAPGNHLKASQLALQDFYVPLQTAGLIVMGGVRNILSTMRDILPRASNGIAGGKKGEKGKAQQGYFFHRKLHVQ